jgi:hypothetical protein
VEAYKSSSPHNDWWQEEEGEKAVGGEVRAGEGSFLGLSLEVELPPWEAEWKQEKD